MTPNQRLTTTSFLFLMVSLLLLPLRAHDCKPGSVHNAEAGMCYTLHTTETETYTAALVSHCARMEEGTLAVPRTQAQLDDILQEINSSLLDKYGVWIGVRTRRDRDRGLRTFYEDTDEWTDWAPWAPGRPNPLSSFCVYATPKWHDGDCDQRRLFACQTPATRLYATPCPASLKRWGKHCDEWCGKCAGSGYCHRVTGRCLEGCNMTGHAPGPCDKPCPNGTYGMHCSEPCGWKCIELSCNPDNGYCLKGCERGYLWPLCVQQCPKMKYGENCSSDCGRGCAGERGCHFTTGICHDGCMPGFESPWCHKVCSPGMYGQNCVLRCNHCSVNDSDGTPLCDAANGYCLYKCSEMFRGDHCNIPYLPKPSMIWPLIYTGFLLFSFATFYFGCRRDVGWANRRMDSEIASREPFRSSAEPPSCHSHAV